MRSGGSASAGGWARRMLPGLTAMCLVSTSLVTTGVAMASPPSATPSPPAAPPPTPESAPPAAPKPPAPRRSLPVAITGAAGVSAGLTMAIVSGILVAITPCVTLPGLPSGCAPENDNTFAAPLLLAGGALAVVSLPLLTIGLERADEPLKAGWQMPRQPNTRRPSPGRTFEARAGLGSATFTLTF